MQIFETHCHLNSPKYARDRDAVLARSRAAGVCEHLIIGYCREANRAAAALASPDQGLYAAAGIHPHDSAEWSAETEAELRQLLAQPGVVALGEIGLDFYRNLAPRETQYTTFLAQLDLALELDLPIVVHTRESVTPSLDVLEPYARRGLRAIMHCWSGTAAEARRARELGFLLGVGGTVTYGRDPELPVALREATLDGLVLETDCPYLTPVPHRSERNEPAYLPLIARKVAEILAREAEEVAETTRETARRFLGAGRSSPALPR